MRVLVACEYSGIVRDAFLAEGHDAISCDLLPTESPGPHIQGDVRPLLQEPWDLVIAHPPCTYLCNSGVRWLYEKDGRWDAMNEACDFFLNFLLLNRVAVENPVMHGHALRRISRRHSFTVQPFQFWPPGKQAHLFLDKWSTAIDVHPNGSTWPQASATAQPPSWPRACQGTQPHLSRHRPRHGPAVGPPRPTEGQDGGNSIISRAVRLPSGALF